MLRTFFTFIENRPWGSVTVPLATLSVSTTLTPTIGLFSSSTTVPDTATVWARSARAKSKSLQIKLLSFSWVLSLRIYHNGLLPLMAELFTTSPLGIG